eukprot:SAG11_NODE_5357_length_1584_cov_3.170370_1_plen_143_part_10
MAAYGGRWAPLTEKQTDECTEHIGGERLRLGASAMQGWRTEMEDAHAAAFGLPPTGLPPLSLLGVFDGHGGRRVAQEAAAHLWGCLGAELAPALAQRRLALAKLLHSRLAAAMSSPPDATVLRRVVQHLGLAPPPSHTRSPPQ